MLNLRIYFVILTPLLVSLTLITYPRNVLGFDSSFVENSQNDEYEIAQTKSKKRGKKSGTKRRAPSSSRSSKSSEAPVDTVAPSTGYIAIKGVVGMVSGDGVKDLDTVIAFGGDGVYSLGSQGLNFKGGLIYWGSSTDILSITVMSFGAGAYYAYPITEMIVLDPGLRLAYTRATTEVLFNGRVTSNTGSAIYAVIEPAVNFNFGNLFASAEIRYPIGITTGDGEGKISGDFKTMYMMLGAGYKF